MKLLLKDGIKYLPYNYSSEDELINFILEHPEEIFGEDTIFFPGKKIKAKSGIGAIPDGFLLSLKDKKWYIFEAELSTHPLDKHIIPQIINFTAALSSESTRNKLSEFFFQEIQKNPDLRIKFEKLGITQEKFKFIADFLKQPPKILIVIDQITPHLEEIIKKLPFPCEVREFKTFHRENTGPEVHIHLVDTLYEIEGVKEQPSPPLPFTSPKVEITVTSPSFRKYGYIPVSKQVRSFFPGYKIPFVLETDIGVLKAWVTGAPKGTKIGDPNKGQVIMGGLKNWYRAHPEVTIGTKLIITEIKPKERYRLEVGREEKG
ncbi:hypothetical protein J7K56_01470 [Candidatus Calescamantes bacterium]|nr:hypothetical protein [Candidatus Calescamantes bacterium]